MQRKLENNEQYAIIKLLKLTVNKCGWWMGNTDFYLQWPSLINNFQLHVTAKAWLLINTRWV